MTDPAALLAALAVPRLVGTQNHLHVRELLKRELTTRGFTVEEHAFSGRPSRLLLGSPARIQGVNLIAHRPPARPSVWLTAHYDSKGQPISMAVRLAGAVALVLGAAGLAVGLGPAVVLLAAGLAIFAMNRATDRSPGAVDNASGVLTVLSTVDRLPREAPVGVILPDAEEYGLVGARALVRERPELFVDAAVVNFDGVDEGGGTTALLHRPGPVGEAVAAALGARRARWLPVVVDGIPLARPAKECVTIMKGSLETMLVVHTPRDTVQRLTLAGVREVAEGVARALGAA